MVSVDRKQKSFIQQVRKYSLQVNDTAVSGKSPAEVQALIRKLAPGGLVLAVTRSPPMLSPLTPTISFSHSTQFRPVKRQDAQVQADADGSS